MGRHYRTRYHERKRQSDESEKHAEEETQDSASDEKCASGSGFSNWNPFDTEKTLDPRRRKRRNTALVLICAGLFILIQHHIGLFTVLAIILIFFGVRKIRKAEEKTGYVLIGIAVVLLMGNHFGMLAGIVLLSLGYYFIRSNRTLREHSYLHKQSFIESVKWGAEPWILRNRSMWTFIGEIHLDFSMAIVEEQETVIILQGVIGDINLRIPDDLGVSIEAFAFVGQMNVSEEKEAGLMNRIVWRTNNYDFAEHKVKLMISYIVGDIDVRIM